MPAGLAGFARDPTSNTAIGLGQSFLTPGYKYPDLGDKKGNKAADKKSKMSTQSAKQKEAEAASRKSLESVDTLPRYEENPSEHGSQSSTTRPSRVSSAIDRAKAKLTGKGKDKQVLPDNEADFEKLKEKERKKEERKEQYERLGLSDKTKFGMGGMQYGGS